ncbi:hypothetical protein [Paenibacillus sp. L3-i20]|uniref:hypothetical protein n=1 Tax=Paenibacillus sp. L3-i20 TaxID=2905833 RepID=UPI001EDD3661|nr:hypothetical protein [Paenibacillus sp. L3-i20]GKU79194.1 hypothetical protein L3i20_v235910 [Paenibacillus sp. L3-i20]
MTYSIRIMLIGISIMLVGLYIQNEQGIELYGGEFFVFIAGFILVIVGACKGYLDK